MGDNFVIGDVGSVRSIIGGRVRETPVNTDVYTNIDFGVQLAVRGQAELVTANVAPDEDGNINCGQTVVNFSDVEWVYP